LTEVIEFEAADKRHHPRFQWAVEIVGSVLSPLQAPEQASVSLQGVTKDIGSGGVSVVSDRPVPTNAVLRCQFAISGHPTHIPTLMRVRWSDKVEGINEYNVGLQFLI
jgi:hypothetical protein